MARHLIKTALELKSLVARATDEARARNTRIRVNDGDGLRVEVTPTGNASWQMTYRMPGRSDRPYTIGKYPALSMKVAREIADEVRVKVARSIDPNDEKKAMRGERLQVQGPNVSAILDEFLAEKRRENYAARSLTTMHYCFEHNVVPVLGTRVAKSVTPDDIEQLLRGVEARGAHETRRRLTTWLRQAFTLAGIKPNPVRGIEDGDFKRPVPSREGHPGAFTPQLLATVLRSIAAFPGSLVTRAALLIHARCFMRPDELRLANWDQVRGDFFHAMVILEDGSFEHLIPLTPQAKALFDLLRPVHKTFILPGTRYGQRISNSTLGVTLKALGWQGIQTTHGFRKSASTLLNEMGWDPRHVDLQLSHRLKSKGTEAVYNKAKYLQQRIPMMHCWSDYIDQLLDPHSGVEEMMPLTWADQWRKGHAQAA